VAQAFSSWHRGTLFFLEPSTAHITESRAFNESIHSSHHRKQSYDESIEGQN
jgi:hypothetical protein